MLDKIMNDLSSKSTHLINSAFPEELDQPTCFDRRKDFLDYFQGNKLWREKGLAPRGDLTWTRWAASPGSPGTPGLKWSALILTQSV